MIIQKYTQQKLYNYISKVSKTNPLFSLTVKNVNYEIFEMSPNLCLAFV